MSQGPRKSQHAAHLSPAASPPGATSAARVGGASYAPTRPSLALVVVSIGLFAVNAAALPREGTWLSEIVPVVLSASMIPRPAAHRIPAFPQGADASAAASEDGVPAPPRVGVQTVLHLRDLVIGCQWLSRRGHPLALTPAQRARLSALLPFVRANFEGPPEAFDDALEARLTEVLTMQQKAGVQRWVEKQTERPDCMDALRDLEHRVGLPTAHDPRAKPAH